MHFQHSDYNSLQMIEIIHILTRHSQNRYKIVMNHLPLMHAFSVHDVNPDSEHVHVLHPSVEG